MMAHVHISRDLYRRTDYNTLYPHGGVQEKKDGLAIATRRPHNSLAIKVLVLS